MRKITIIVLLLILITGCNNITYNNTPSSKVSNFFENYKTLNKNIIDELNLAIKKNKDKSNFEKKTYKQLLIKQYKNLEYKIKNEEIKNNDAYVDVEIEVYDYEKENYYSKKYFLNNLKLFNIKANENIKENKKYKNYKLSKLKKTKKRKKYSITLQLKKENNIWKLVNLKKEDLKKIHGFTQ